MILIRLIRLIVVVVVVVIVVVVVVIVLIVVVVVVVIVVVVVAVVIIVVIIVIVAIITAVVIVVAVVVVMIIVVIIIVIIIRCGRGDEQRAVYMIPCQKRGACHTNRAPPPGNVVYTIQNRGLCEFRMTKLCIYNSKSKSVRIWNGKALRIPYKTRVGESL